MLIMFSQKRKERRINENIWKALSVMLCLCMIMSAMAVGLNVFAQEKSEAVERFEANVKAFTGDVGKAEPSAEELEAYEKLVAEYKALGNSDKESVDVMFSTYSITTS